MQDVVAVEEVEHRTKDAWRARGQGPARDGRRGCEQEGDARQQAHADAKVGRARDSADQRRADEEAEVGDCRHGGHRRPALRLGGAAAGRAEERRGRDRHPGSCDRRSRAVRPGSRARPRPGAGRRTTSARRRPADGGRRSAARATGRASARRPWPRRRNPGPRPLCAGDASRSVSRKRALQFSIPPSIMNASPQRSPRTSSRRESVKRRVASRRGEAGYPRFSGGGNQHQHSDSAQDGATAPPRLPARVPRRSRPRGTPPRRARGRPA